MTLRRENLLVVRPATALEPQDVDLIVGSQLEHDVERYQALTLDHKVSASSQFNSQAVSYWSEEMQQKGMKKR